MSLFSKLFGSNDREVRKLRKMVDVINELEPDIAKLTDDELQAKTQAFRKRLHDGEEVDAILPEAFAVVRESSKRLFGQRHYDVQLMGGIVLHQGNISEMKTGEGKTLTSTLAVYLNALEGKGVHVVTVNDYLARRDCNWMGAIYHFLGLSTSCIVHDSAFLYTPQKVDNNEVSVEKENMQPISRREAYAADITYGTNNEFGFDYLRDNMVQSLEDMVQREHNFAIVDEVDSILIDEARTPLIISAPDTQSTSMYAQFAQLARTLKRDEDFTVDEKLKAISITDAGITKVEKKLNVENLYDPSKIQYVHHLEQALKAQFTFVHDKDYVVKDGQVIIVDDFTGRLMPGRRYSEGLHQAIEAKEGVTVQKESKTMATITFQNYFRLYDKLSGMTGTASTNAEEFAKVYRLDVIEIPTNQIMIRQDHGDVVYKTEEGKFRALVEKIKQIHQKGQPVLVGTIAIEKSEYLSTLLTQAGVKHEVLNAKNHEREAQIVAMAGHRDSVTIATNMAGRGTDIKLDDGAGEVGGLFILGTERHEARRIDNQLRGRAGRQGDPGESQFYVSLEDELMRRFGGDKLKNMMDKFGLPEDEAIENRMISKMIENAQTKIEGFNFDIRKHVLEYDDVMNKQREVVYKKRRRALESESPKDIIIEMLEEKIKTLFNAHILPEEERWDIEKIGEDLAAFFPFEQSRKDSLLRIGEDDSLTHEEKDARMQQEILSYATDQYDSKEQELGADNMRRLERHLMLRTIDMLWMQHLDEIDALRQGIGLRGYGQRDPLIEYKKEAYIMFMNFMENVGHTVLRSLFHIERTPQDISFQSQQEQKLNYSGGDAPEQFASATSSSNAANVKQSPVVSQKTVGRNEPCPCGSGKKYKKCCGK